MPFGSLCVEIDFTIRPASVKKHRLFVRGFCSIGCIIHFKQIFTAAELQSRIILMVPLLNLKVGEHCLTLVVFFNVNKTTTKKKREKCSCASSKAITVCEISFTHSVCGVSYCSSSCQTAFDLSGGGNHVAFGAGTLAIIKFKQRLEERRLLFLMRKEQCEESKTARFCSDSISHVTSFFPWNLS